MTIKRIIGVILLTIGLVLIGIPLVLIYGLAVVLITVAIASSIASLIVIGIKFIIDP